MFTIHLAFNLRADLIALVCALTIALAVSLLTNLTAHLEERLITKLSLAMSNRRWFIFWTIGFPIWAAMRSILLGYIDWDTIITTGFWSWWPFAVENIVKVAQGAVLNMIAELVVEIKKQNDRTEQRDKDTVIRDAESKAREEALLTLSNKLLDFLNQFQVIPIEPEGGESSHGG